MPVARPEPAETRVIAHLDLDCFYVQVEQRKRPELRGKPSAVVQFNPWKGGGLIAVSYEARRAGVTRNMRGDDAKKVCPDIELVQVPMAHGHAYLAPYRDAGSEVVAILSRMGTCERASVDEVYLDITEAAAARLLEDPPLSQSLSEEAQRTHVLGLVEDGEERMTAGEWLCQRNASRDDQLLACGALIVAELRAAVLQETQFTCSAGIAHNKMLAKLTSSMHKPAQQTVVPSSYVPALLASLPIKKIGQLGGKLGKSLKEDLGVTTAADLLPFPEIKLQDLYGVNTGTWLWNVARGRSGDKVQGRVLPKSHSCSKTFAGPKSLKDMASVMYWLGEMAEELQERLDLDLENNNRTARLLVFHAACHLKGRAQSTNRKFPSKSCTLRYGKDKIVADARVLFEKCLQDFCPSSSLSPLKATGGTSCNWAVTALSVGASNISALPSRVSPITSFFSSPARHSSEEPRICLSPPGSPTSSPSWTPYSLTDEESHLRTADGASCCESMEECQGEAQSPIVDLSVEDPTFSIAPDGQFIDTVEECQGEAEPDGEILLSEKRPNRVNEITSATSAARLTTDERRRFSRDEQVRNDEIELQSEAVVATASSDNINAEAGSRTQCMLGDQETSMDKCPVIAKVTTGSGRLQHLWQAKSARSVSPKRVQTFSMEWEYKHEEIDEKVLLELPLEIQRELRSSLRLKRPRPPKRTSISDFFQSQSSTSKSPK
ncbi:unnamed protein product [Sphagnum compactum]